jgi:hypothetical protein
LVSLVDHVVARRSIRKLTITDCGLTDDQKTMVQRAVIGTDIELVLDPPSAVPITRQGADLDPRQLAVASVKNVISVWFDRHDPDAPLPKTQYYKLPYLYSALAAAYAFPANPALFAVQ